MPVIGDLIRLKDSIDKGINDIPFVTVINEDLGFGKLPKVIGLFTSFESPLLFITDPEMMNEVYVGKNKFIDKHDYLSRVLHPLIGDAMLF